MTQQAHLLTTCRRSKLPQPHHPHAQACVVGLATRSLHQPRWAAWAALAGSLAGGKHALQQLSAGCDGGLQGAGQAGVQLAHVHLLGMAAQEAADAGLKALQLQLPGHLQLAGGVLHRQKGGAGGRGRAALDQHGVHQVQGGGAVEAVREVGQLQQVARADGGRPGAPVQGVEAVQQQQGLVQADPRHGQLAGEGGGCSRWVGRLTCAFWRPAWAGSSLSGLPWTPRRRAPGTGVRCEGVVPVQLDQGVPRAGLGGQGAEAEHVGHDDV